MNWRDNLQQAVHVLDTELFAISGTPITGATLLIVAVVVVFTAWLASFVQRASERLMLGRGKSHAATAGLISRLLRYAVMVVGLGVGIHTLGINLSALFAAGALFAAAIGFALQSVFANFVSGVILLAERAIRLGDVLELDGQLVRVTDLGLRVTVVRTLDEEDMIVPNSLLVQSTVKNLTMKDRLLRLRVAVGVAYESDLEVVRQALEECVETIAWRSEQRRPVVLLTAFGTSSVDYEVSVWIDHPWLSRRRRSELRETIWLALQEASVTIAFPQLDVHLDEPVIRSLRGDAAA